MQGVEQPRTRAHIVDDAKLVEVNIITADATIFTVSVVKKVDLETDLALLKAEITFPETVVLGQDDDVGIGTEVYAIGFPYKFGKVSVHGHIARLHLNVTDPEAQTRVYEDEMAIEMQGGPGTSGSGVFLRRDGALVGVAHIYSTSGTDAPVMSFGLAVPVSKVRAFLDAQSVKYRTR